MVRADGDEFRYWAYGLIDCTDIPGDVDTAIACELTMQDVIFEFTGEWVSNE